MTLRKRSEIGKLKKEPLPKPPQEETFEAFEEEEDPRGTFVELGETIPETKAPVLGAQTDEDISAFTKELQKAGFRVSLIDTAGWGTVKRDEVRAWLKTMDARGIPDVISVAVDRSYGMKPHVQGPPLEPAPPARLVETVHKELEPVVPSPPSKPVRQHASSLSDDFNRLVETVLKELELDAEYNELEGFLEIGDNRRDYATINEHLDKADRRALRANALWGNAVIEYESLKLDQEEVNANLWKEAKEELELSPEDDEEELIEKAMNPTPGSGIPPVPTPQAKKKKAARKKLITNADVEAKIAELYPDEWRGGRMRLKRAEIAVARCEAFAKRWSERARSLQVMLGACRK